MKVETDHLFSQALAGRSIIDNVTIAQECLMFLIWSELRATFGNEKLIGKIDKLNYMIQIQENSFTIANLKGPLSQ